MTPKFKYVQDVVKYVKEIETEVRDLLTRIKNQTKVQASALVADSARADMDALIRAYQPTVTPELITAALGLASSTAGMRIMSALERFVITDDKPVSKTKRQARLKQSIDLRLKKTVIPNISKLKTQYALLDELHKKYQAVDAAETQLRTQFRDSRDTDKVLKSLSDFKTTIEKGMREAFAFLADVADAHVPPAFKEYTAAVAAELEENVVFRDSQTFLYVTVSEKGSLVFTSYIMLIDALNEDGELAPSLYVAIQWNQGTMKNGEEVEAPYVRVFLDHDFDLPDALSRRTDGEDVSTVQSAVKIVGRMLDLENFSSSIGVVPLNMRLKMDPSALTKRDFNYQDYVRSVEVDTDENVLRFVLNRAKGVDKNSVQEIAKALYTEVQGKMKGSRSTKMRMKVYREADNWKIDFIITELAQGTTVSLNDIQFLKTRFGLNDRQLRRVAQIFSEVGE